MCRQRDIRLKRELNEVYINTKGLYSLCAEVGRWRSCARAAYRAARSAARVSAYCAWARGFEGLGVGGFGVGKLGVGVEWVISPAEACRARWRSTSKIPLGSFCKDFLNKEPNSKLKSSVASSRFYPREIHAFIFLTAALAFVPFRFALV
jgi:hypothetical protein